MLDEDIPASPGPIRGPQTNGSGRFILQHFVEQLDDVAQIFYPHNQNARQTADIDNFPPPVLLEMWYGCAAVLRWGVQPTVDAIWSLAGAHYYDNLPGDDGDDDAPGDDDVPGDDGAPGDDDAPGDDRALGDDDLNGRDNSDRELLTPPKGKETAQSSRGQGKEGHTQSGARLNTMGEAVEFLMLLWTHPMSGHRVGPSPTQEKKNRSRDKVDAWLQAQ